MASSRASSPGESSSGSSSSSSPPGTPLTPRSKLKALFADLSSDEENGSPTRKHTKPTNSSGHRASSATVNLPSAVEKSPARGHDESDDDEVVRPRGRLAARMQAQETTREEEEEADSEPEVQIGDARERVRRMLAKAAQPQEKTDQNDNSDGGMASGEEEDEVVTSRQHRRLKQKAPRRSPTPASKAGSVPPQREESPMFVSPAKLPSPRQAAPTGSASDSDDDLPPATTKNHRFMALLAKKRQEQEAKDAEEARKREARLARQAAADEELMDDGESSDITDDEGGRKLTQEATGGRRPAARKAGRRALEEMNRETQRMSRSLQLAHEAKTRKKITKASLFEKFNYKPAGAAPAVVEEEKQPASSSRPGTPASDVEMRDTDTPPSSPPVVGKEADVPAPVVANAQNDDEPLSTLDAVLDQVSSSQPLDKGKGKAIAPELQEQLDKKAMPPPAKRHFRVKLPPMQIQTNKVSIGSDDDDDDELVITNTRKSKIDAIFDRIPAKRENESRSMLALRYLAQVDGSPGKKTGSRGRRGEKERGSMTAVELQCALQQRARQQAKLERDRRMEVLKAKGVHVPTEEEREKEMSEIEDIVARARREAEEIMQRERELAKAERKANGEGAEGATADPLAWDDSDASADGDYNEEEPEEIELSGSDDEDAEMEDGGDGLIDEAAESADESEDEEPEVPEDDAKDGESDEEMVPNPQRKARRNKHAALLSDDDEEDVKEDDQVAETPKPKTTPFKSPSAHQTTDSPQLPTSVLRSATKTFIPGLPVAVGGPAGLGLTQMFAGTMDDSQAEDMMNTPSQPRPTFEPRPTFDSFPDSNFSQTANENAADMILNSQPAERETQAAEESQGVQLHYTQSQMHGFDSLMRDQDATQASDFLELTQDGGFQNYSPLKQRFVEPPPSTADTVPADPSQPQDAASQHPASPLLHKKGKLRRKIAMAVVPESDEEMEADPVVAAQPDEEAEEDEFGFGTTKAATAFSLMKDAAAAAEERKQHKALEAYNKKKSKAKDMVEDQAEESEDEYAGLGGADGEDSDDESAASVKDMIDDDAEGSGVDKAKLAAFYADRERASDEKQVEKLFRDITSGMLRRKRGAGADFDLSDGDDGGEARRRMKRRQFQKMQRALFADERVSKVAENPRNSAFLRTIEDRGSSDDDDDEDMDFLFEQPQQPGKEEGSSAEEKSQQQQQQQKGQQEVAIPDSQPTAAERAPAAQRRTRNRDRKPATLGEIRESLSNLLDDPHGSLIPATDDGLESSEEDEEEQTSSTDKENRHPRRRAAAAVAVVDRISLKRAGSSGVGAHPAAGGRMAFAAASSGSFSSKVPALLRRATTNSSSGNSGSGSGANGAGNSSGGFGSEEGPAAAQRLSRVGAGGASAAAVASKKKSGINYFAREGERRAAMAEKEKRREARKWKGAEGRGAVVGGLFGAGKFE